MAPDDLKDLGKINFIHLDRGDIDYWELGVRKVLNAKPLMLPPYARPRTPSPTAALDAAAAAANSSPADEASANKQNMVRHHDQIIGFSLHLKIKNKCSSLPRHSLRQFPLCCCRWRRVAGLWLLLLLPRLQLKITTEAKGDQP